VSTRRSRRLAWLAQPAGPAGALVLTLTGGGIGWRIHHLPGAATGALTGVVITLILAGTVDRIPIARTRSSPVRKPGRICRPRPGAHPTGEHEPCVQLHGDSAPEPDLR
jgi:hypothetical protein